VPNAPSAAAKLQKHQLSPTPESAWLRFDRNVSRELVHRRALAEVLIADTVQVAEDEFLLGTQLPRAHTLWSDRRYPFHDPLITIEVCRQACLAIPQRYYDVGPDWQFISKQIYMRVVNLDAFADDQTAPPEGILRALFSNKRERHGRLRELTVESELMIDGVSAATVSGDLMFFPKITYQRMRAQQRRHKPLDGLQPQAVARPVRPARVGRSFDRNVTIGVGAIGSSAIGESRYAAIVDHHHPCFFDHPLDHLPGALLIEVYRQAAIAAAAAGGAGAPAEAVITRCDVQLSDFAELEAPIECSARVIDQPTGDRVHIGLTLHQLDGDIGDADVELEFVSLADGR
jgi:hypothetical protein